MKEILLLYVPVLHEGYIKIFKKYSQEVECLYILGKDLIDEFTFLEKEIRAISPDVIKVLIDSLNLFNSVQIIHKETLCEIIDSHIITANECLIKRLVEKYLPNEEIQYDTVFLRWDESHVDVKKPINYESISTSEPDIQIIKLAEGESEKTSDWWRKVGAVVVKNGEILMSSHNRHVPSEHTNHAFGDIRDFIQSGKHSDISSALHAEQGIITQAAKTVLEGASIYLTVFPCAVCAKMIAYSGIKKCYFSGGHASFDGEKVLKANGVELIFVDKNNPPSS